MKILFRLGGYLDEAGFNKVVKFYSHSDFLQVYIQFNILNRKHVIFCVANHSAGKSHDPEVDGLKSMTFYNFV